MQVIIECEAEEDFQELLDETPATAHDEKRGMALFPWADSVALLIDERVQVTHGDETYIAGSEGTDAPNAFIVQVDD